MSFTREEILGNRRKWCGNLRDGSFQQTTGQLCRETFRGDRTYCCLGVVCEVIGPDYGVRRSEYDAEYYQYRIPDGIPFDDGSDYTTLDTALNGALLAALGLNEEMQNFLIKCNDSLKFTFAEIADVVEALPVYGFDGDAEGFMIENFEKENRLPETLKAKIAAYNHTESPEL